MTGWILSLFTVTFFFSTVRGRNALDLPACRLLRSDGVDSGRIVVVGDIHGSNVGLREILFAAGVVDSVDSCKWSTKEANRGTTLVQMGDLVDRGSEALEAWTCLDSLKASLPADGNGNVVRLIGNHEIWWLENRFHMINKADTKPKVLALVKRMKEQIANGELVGAHVVDVNAVPILFVHAGYRSTYLKASKSTDPRALATEFNEVLVECLKSCKADWEACPFDAYGELFQAGPERGGSHLGGPVWTDFQVLVSDDAANGRQRHTNEFVQIVGHSAASCDDGDDSNGYPDLGSCPELIRATGDIESVCVDGGMVYGTRSFLEINKAPGALLAHEKEGTTAEWKVRQLNAETGICK